ncbi:MAG TPA: pyruvate formate lyase family protein [Spirochaetota bacterium]|nr:pyruvate formate lyase family protein [Spirochaetota bacterium]HNT09775.1 pyruvate formate lyase family protein [Spirochaetota bacterium]
MYTTRTEITRSPIRDYLALINSMSKFVIGTAMYTPFTLLKRSSRTGTNGSPANTRGHLGRQLTLRGALGFIANRFNASPRLRDQLMGTQGWINAIIGLRSDDGLVEQAIIIRDGRITIADRIPENANVIVIFREEEDVLKQLQSSPEEGYKMILRGRIRVEGNMMYMGFWDYLNNLIVGGSQKKAVLKQIEQHRKANQTLACGCSANGRQERRQRTSNLLRGEKVDPGVKHLADPYLSTYTLGSFPRLERMRAERINATPEITAEYGKLVTDFFVENGYETKRDGSLWDPNIRTASCLKYVMENRKPLIRTGDLLAGTYTPNPVFGTVGHPNSLGTFLWGELNTCRHRELEPFTITPETAEILHKHVFPFWVDRNITRWWNVEFDTPLTARIHDRFFAVFFWKTTSNMENSPGFERVLKKGLAGLRAEIDRELREDANADEEKRNTLAAMKIAMDGVSAYARNLAQRARDEAAAETDAARAQELEAIAGILDRVPDQPARTLHEAIQALWIMHIAVGMENIDDGPSLGRLDQILQPYFEADIAQCADDSAKETYIRNAIELLGSLFLRINSHWPQTPDIGTLLNSGSPLNTTIVVGGVTEDGGDAVNDLSYLILKVTEMLVLNDPNMHARYQPGVNSRAFLRRVCEVDYITGATPCIHGDETVISAVSAGKDWRIEDIRGWTPTGCVEPSLPGKSVSATSSLEVNLVAPFEMALNNGTHPLMQWDLGPKTGSIENGDFSNFEDFQNAFTKQCKFLFEQTVIGNNQLGAVHQRHLPAPLMSSLFDGCIEKGRGYARGGATYNSSGVSLTGLTDVVDSLMAIKKLVYDEKRVTFPELKKAIDSNFVGYEKLHAMIKSRVPRFGSGNQEALDMANWVTGMVNGYYRNQKNYRGGAYTTGWWSMNYHTAYGRVAGASASGRLDGEPFTPGLTPHPAASTNMLDNLLDVAQLDPKTIDNNIAFNVRIVPSSKDTHEQTVERMTNYVETFIKKGGMQVQFNVVDTDTLKDAMAHPEAYPDLLVRVSGYCGYFTKLHRDLQLEIIRRCEYGLD